MLCPVSCQLIAMAGTRNAVIRTQVLGRLGPGDPLHAPEGRVDEDDRHADHDADVDVHFEKAREDDADAPHLPGDVDEADEDRADHGHDPRRGRFVAVADEVRHGEVAELAKVGSEEQREQHEAARPSHEVDTAGVPHRRDEPRHREERGRAHPVGPRGHAVDRGRDAAPGDVEPARVLDARKPGDRQVQREGHADEDVGPGENAHRDASGGSGAVPFW